jgi:CHAD domain-containing protein
MLIVPTGFQETSVGFELTQDESVPAGIKRIETEEIDAALEQLTKKMDAEHRDKAIHEARKSFKKLRAVVRLMRDEFGDELYARENITFRDAGRPLSDARDAKVLVDAFDSLLKHFQKELTAEPFAPLRQLLVNRRALASQVLTEDTVQRVIAEMLAARERVSGWPLRHEGWDGLKPALRRVYAAGREAFEEAYRHPAFETFHDWRKRAKDLWYATELLGPIWPELMHPLADQIHDLSDYLGDDHDLAVLRQTLQDDPGAAPHREAADALAGLADARRLELQRAAKLLGDRIYADKPRAFMRRLEAYWDAWRRPLTLDAKV